MTDWKEIGTAPKTPEIGYDPPRALLSDGQRVSIGRFYRDDYWTDESVIDWRGMETAVHAWWIPTHWAELPELP